MAAGVSCRLFSVLPRSLKIAGQVRRQGRAAPLFQPVQQSQALIHGAGNGLLQLFYPGQAGSAFDGNKFFRADGVAPMLAVERTGGAGTQLPRAGHQGKPQPCISAFQAAVGPLASGRFSKTVQPVINLRCEGLVFDMMNILRLHHRRGHKPALQVHNLQIAVHQ